jgi:hypothetical protein
MNDRATASLDCTEGDPQPMNAYRSNALAAGVLFIVATAAGLISTAIARPLLVEPVDLAGITANQATLFAAVLLKFVAALTSSGIALALYPVVRRYSGSLAIGSVALRLGEGMFYVIGALGLMLLVSLGREAAGVGVAEADGFRHESAMVLAACNSAGFVAGVVFFGLGGLMYYWVFFQAALLPRWLSAWGIAGVTMALVAAVLVMFGDIEPASPVHLVLNFPIFLQEMVFAGWLLVRGFDPRAIAATPAVAASPAVAGAAA